MNVNDASVLKMINKLIVIDRLNKNQILHLVNLVSISKSIIELEENMKWEIDNYNMKQRHPRQDCHEGRGQQWTSEERAGPHHSRRRRQQSRPPQEAPAPDQGPGSASPAASTSSPASNEHVHVVG